MQWQSFRDRLAGAVAACEAVGAQSTRLAIEPPATATELAAVERALERPLPAALRDAFLGFSRGVDMCWFLREGVASPFPDIFRGDCQWDLGALLALDTDRRRWIAVCDGDGESAVNPLWRHALPFAAVGNGDVLALDLSASGAPVVFASRTGSPTNGWRLADDFHDFLDRSSHLAFVGPEPWQLAPFLVNSTAGLVTGSANAREWRRWFGFPEQTSYEC